MNRYLFALVALILSVTLVPAAWCSETSLLDNDFLDDDSGSSFRDLMNNLSSDEHLASMSFSNLMDVLSSDEHLDSVSFNNIDDVIGDSNNTNGTTGNTTEEDNEPDEIVLLNEGVEGANGNGPTSTHTNDSVVGHTDSNYWRAWRSATENQRKQAIYEGTYAPENAITLGHAPWSFTYWSMNHCGLAYHRSPIVGANALKNEQQAREKKFMLSPLEAYDTWYYNVHGSNPHTAAWEAVNHNTGKDGTRKNEDTDEYAQYWILKSDLVKIGPSLPFRLNMPDGRLPEQRTGNDPETVQYTLTVGRNTHNNIPGQVRYAEPKFFGSKLVEEFHLPIGAVQNMGIRGMDVRYTVYEFDEKGYPVKELGQYSWNDIQSNPQLRKHHVAKQPEFIRLFRSVNEEEGSYGQTINWYYIQYELKPGLSEYSWWGHCGGWSAASVNTPLPKTLPIQKDLGKEVTLVRLKTNSPAEAVDSNGNVQLKVDDSDYELIPTRDTKLYISPSQYFGVATEMWNVADENVTNREDPFYAGLNVGDFMGNRVYENTPKTDELGEKIMGDIYPNHLFSILMHHVGERKEGIVCDTNKGSQVWNSPVRGFTYRHTWVPTPQDEIASGYYEFDLYIDYVPYGGYNSETDPAKYILPNKFPDDWRGYKAKLYADKKTNRIYRGEWIAGNVPGKGVVNSVDKHPDFCWIPVSPRYPEKLHQNHNLEDEKAEEFLKH